MDIQVFLEYQDTLDIQGGVGTQVYQVYQVTLDIQD